MVKSVSRPSWPLRSVQFAHWSGESPDAGLEAAVDLLDVHRIGALSGGVRGHAGLGDVGGVALRGRPVRGEVGLRPGQLVGVAAGDRLEVGLQVGLRGQRRSRRGLGLVVAAAAGDQAERQQQGQEQDG